MDSRHTAPTGAGGAPPVPEPTYAERARTLAHVACVGTLATLSRRRPGYPFASVMPYALDGAGQPLVLISSMAMHTQNLQADPRASLLVTQPGLVREPHEADDPLARARLTLMGDAHVVPPGEVSAARAAYLARHERARYWVDFEDFAFWRLQVVDLYFVGGFAAMDWVSAADYFSATPDPLADAAASIMEHMNRDHADALAAYARFYAGEEADEATMVAVDRLGFKVRLRRADRLSSVRIAFPREVRSASEGRDVLIEMLRRARAV
jgi:putative heme iron utilization protein